MENIVTSHWFIPPAALHKSLEKSQSVLSSLCDILVLPFCSWFCSVGFLSYSWDSFSCEYLCDMPLTECKKKNKEKKNYIVFLIMGLQESLESHSKDPSRHDKSIILMEMVLKILLTSTDSQRCWMSLETFPSQSVFVFSL